MGQKHVMILILSCVVFIFISGCGGIEYLTPAHLGKKSRKAKKIYFLNTKHETIYVSDTGIIYVRDNKYEWFKQILPKKNRFISKITNSEEYNKLLETHKAKFSENNCVGLKFFDIEKRKKQPECGFDKRFYFFFTVDMNDTYAYLEFIDYSRESKIYKVAIKFYSAKIIHEKKQIPQTIAKLFFSEKMLIEAAKKAKTNRQLEELLKIGMIIGHSTDGKFASEAKRLKDQL